MTVVRAEHIFSGTSGLPPVTLASVLHDVRAYLLRYVVMSPEQVIACTLWAAHTHAIGAAETTPYLQVTSATKRAGKTRLLEVLDPIVARPWMTGRTSAAALVRKVDSDAPTLLLDESDAAFQGEKEYAEALRGILNSGYKRSGKATLCVGKGGEITVKDFSTFGAKALAGIGKLPDTVADRAIPIVLRRRMTSEPVQRWRERDGRLEAAHIYQQLVTWSRDVLDILRAARPALPGELGDRAADVWEPLLAIADMAGGDWPTRARASAKALMSNVQDADPVVELLTDLKDIIASEDGVIPTNTIIAKLTALEDRPWATWRRGKPISGRGLAMLLGPLGIHPDKFNGSTRGYRTVVFADAIARYLPEQGSLCPTANVDGPKTAGTCDFTDPAENASVQQLKADSIGQKALGHLKPGDGEDAVRF